MKFMTQSIFTPLRIIPEDRDPGETQDLLERLYLTVWGMYGDRLGIPQEELDSGLNFSACCQHKLLREKQKESWGGRGRRREQGQRGRGVLMKVAQ
ncbi:hypothetical protein PDJAM_G00220630 [Pangasius djambal]|uniref:Uncharacterized protein n=1 Tax=Pangasius djambal TaxID=1691987 RepID=A0ACC5YCV7_9TELE|nr:hypothetical protein [Pangasius djambal]